MPQRKLQKCRLRYEERRESPNPNPRGFDKAAGGRSGRSGGGSGRNDDKGGNDDDRDMRKMSRTETME